MFFQSAAWNFTEQVDADHVQAGGNAVDLVSTSVKAVAFYFSGLCREYIAFEVHKGI